LLGGAALGCRGSAGKGGGGGDTAADTGGDSGGDTAADTGGDTSGDTGGGDALDDASLTALLVGTWRAVSMDDSGTVEPLPDDPASYLLLGADGGVGFGCGNAPFGTWVATAGGPAPAVGRIDVAFGETQLVWPVLSVDAEGFVFAEGGDTFTHVRAACP
jgi:hypothetical protein